MNDKYGITFQNLLNTLPPVLKNSKSIEALAEIAAKALVEHKEAVSVVMLYSRIDYMPEGLLDILAKDLKIDWYAPEYSLSEKRQIIKDSWYVHRRLGTKGAVEKAISAVFSGSKVSEWFEYGGEPYHFKLLIDATFENTNAEKHKSVLDKVYIYKNLRSTLDGIEYIVTPDGYCRIYGGVGFAGIEMNMTTEVSVYGME